MAHERSGSMEIDSDEIVKLEPRAFRPFKTKDEYLYAMKEDLAEWFKTLYEGLEILVDNFFEVLDTGVLLCKHANNVQQYAKEYEKQHPGSPNFANVKFPRGEVQYRENVKPKSFQARDNISNFIAWCRGLGIMDVLLFETDDLVLRKNEKSVILCLLEVARKGAKFGMLAPILVQMEEEIEMEIAGEEPEPFRQIIYNDHMSLDDMVSAALSVCSCPSQFPMVRVSEGKYRVGNSKTLIFVRILRNHVMVRVGGGWDTLQHYLDKHDPCRCKSLGHRIPPQPLPPKRRSSSPVPGPQLSVYQPRLSNGSPSATTVNQNQSSTTRRSSATTNRPQTPTLRSSQTTLRAQDRKYRSTENLLSGLSGKNKPQDSKDRNFPKSMSSDKIGQKQQTRRRSDSANLSRPESTEDLRPHRRLGSGPSPRSMSLAPSEPNTRRSPSREEASRQRSRSAATVERMRPSTPTFSSSRIRYSPRPNEEERLIISRNSSGRHNLSRKSATESEEQSSKKSSDIKRSISSSNLLEKQKAATSREERPPSRIRPSTPQPVKALARSPRDESGQAELYITRNQSGCHEIKRDIPDKQENKTTPRRGSASGMGNASTYRSGRQTPVSMGHKDGSSNVGQSHVRSRTPTPMVRQNSLDQEDTQSQAKPVTSPSTSEPGTIYQRRSRPSTPEPAQRQGKQPVTPRGSLQGPMGFVKRPESGRKTPTFSRENSENELTEIMANATKVNQASPRTSESGPLSSRSTDKTPVSGRRTPNLRRGNSVEKDLKDLASQSNKSSFSASGTVKSPRSRSSSRENVAENNFGSYDGKNSTRKTAGRNSLSTYNFGKPLTRSQEIKLACSTFNSQNSRRSHRRSQSITDPSEHDEIVDEAQRQLEKDYEEMEALFRTYRVEERAQSRNGGAGMTHSSSCNELSALEASDERYATQRNELLDSKEKEFLSKRNASVGDLTNFSLSPRMASYCFSIAKPRRDDRGGPPTRIPTPVRTRMGAEGRLLRSDSGVEINCASSDTYCDDMETRRSTGSDSGIEFKAFSPSGDTVTPRKEREFQRQQASPAQSPTTKVTYTLNI